MSGNDSSFNNVQFFGKILKADGTEFVGGAGAINNSGQSFFDVLTQQPAKFKKQGEIVNTAAFIDISWNYDDILANQIANMLAKLSFHSFTKHKSLPFIDEIKLDISGNTTLNSGTNSNKWISLTTFSISDNQDYNTDAFKTYRLEKTPPTDVNQNDVKNILGKTDKFDVRIYGINYSENVPSVEERALVFEGLNFQIPRVPAIPEFVSENSIASDNSLTFTYDVSATEFERPDSAAVITSAITEYSQNETLSIYPVVTTTLTDTESVNNADKDEDFNITLNGLRSGTSYNYKVKAKNNIKTDYSEFGDIKTSNTLRLPGNGSYSNTSVTFTASNTESVTTPSSTAGLSGQSVIYINSDVEHSFNVNSSNQVIQITKPYSSNQHTETKGYGKWIDNSYNLVKVECYVNDVLKQWVAFHGFNTNGSVVGNSELLNANSNTFNYFTNPSQADSWSGNNNKLGFRLRGNIALKDINYSDISDNVGHLNQPPTPSNISI